MFLYLVVYKSINTDKIFYRLRTTLEELKIGTITSMNWEVIDIQEFYKNRFYTLKRYQIVRDKYIERYNIRNKREDKVKRVLEILQKTFK